MLKKLFTSITIMLLAFCMNAGAQGVQLYKLGTRNATPKFAAIPATSSLDLASDENWIGYWNGVLDTNIGQIGTQIVPNKYDAAICYPAGDANIKGLEITGIRFAFPCSGNIENLRVWMSTTLPEKAEEADIVCDKVTDITGFENSSDPFNEIRFSKSYKSDGTKPVYIGYSFDVNYGSSDDEKFPILLYEGAGDKENAMFLKFKDSEWADYNGYGFGVLALQVLVKGQRPATAVSMPANLPDATALHTTYDVTFPVENAGTTPVSSIKVETGAYGFAVSTNTYTFDEPLEGIGSKAYVTVSSNMPSIAGVYQFFIKIIEVNGEELAEPVTADLYMTVVSEKVANRPLVEAFMGMWAGWCPRSLIAQEKLSGIYGNEISYVSVHLNDVIGCEDYSCVHGGYGFPVTHINRKYLSVDSYYGTGDNEFGINEYVINAKSVLPIADVSAEAIFEDNIVEAKANVRFLYSEDVSHYSVGYVLVEDGMQNAEWSQANYYPNFKGQGLEDVEPLFEPWINGEDNVKGVIYNDVAIAVKGIENGVEGSIPSPIAEGETCVSTTQFDLANYPVIQNTDNLRLIVILFNTKKGLVENTASAPVNVETSVKGVSADNVVETARYAADGTIIGAPQQGINIVKYSDGSIKKVVVR